MFRLTPRRALWLLTIGLAIFVMVLAQQNE
jgi:hypothetical protein